MTNNITQKLKQEVQEVQREIRRKVATYLAAAFSVVAGLAWNEAMKALLEYLFPGSKDSVWAKFIYAVAVTFIVVILSMYMLALIKQEEVADAEKKIKGGVD